MSSHEVGFLPNWMKGQEALVERVWKEDLVERAWKETTEEGSKVSRPKMRKVPEYMATREEFKKFYVPQLIAIGPFHYDTDRDWALGDPYKYKWTAMYLNRTNQTVKGLYNRILSHERELIQRFNTVVPGKYYYYGPWRLVLDGCSILQVLEKSKNSVDAELELKISLDKLIQLHEDILILSNQVPFEALRLMCNDEARLNKCLQNFLEIHGIKPNRGEEKGNEGTHNGVEELKLIVRGDDDQQSIEDDDPVHLLDYLRRALLMRDLCHIYKEVPKRKNLHLRKYRIGTIRELKTAGIHVKKDPNNSIFYPSFNDGILYLPELTVDGSTALIFLNLIAYEMCPDFLNDLEITSYVVFMGSLIDQPEDVKELRSAGILINELANDKEVADLFNKMDIRLVPETSRFVEIRDGIRNHFKSKPTKIKIQRWMREAYETYFRSPWAVIALLAGSLGLVLTFIQTWFAVNPNGK